MKKTLFAFVIFGILLGSCKKQPQLLTRQQMQQQVDSLTNVRIKELDEMANKDLDHRMKIEVKVKVDSIINAKLQQKTKVNPVLNVKTANIFPNNNFSQKRKSNSIKQKPVFK